MVFSAGPDSRTRPSSAPQPLRRLGMMRSETVAGEGPNVPTAGRHIPIPDVPVEPVISLSTFFGGRRCGVGSVLDVGYSRAFVAGRIATAQAFASMGLGPDDVVLIPAFHCKNMISPLEHVGAKHRFFRIKPDLSADLEDIERKIDPSVRALLVAHVFGLHQPMAQLRALADRHGLLLLEDCAHCFFGRIDGRPPGGWGDFAIASERKFFPIYDGGLLVSRRPEIADLRLESQGGLANLKAAYNMVETAVRYGRLPWLRPFIDLLNSTRAALRGKPAVPTGEAEDGGAASAGARGTSSPNPARVNSSGSAPFDSAWVKKRPMLASRIVFALASTVRVVERRRAIYARLAAGLADLPGCAPLRPTLEEGTVPYTFPLRIEALREVFPALEDAAVPMQRFGQFLWPGVDEKTCPTTADLSHHAVQLPCHQEMTDREVESIIARVRWAVLAHAEAAARQRPGPSDEAAPPPVRFAVAAAR